MNTDKHRFRKKSLLLLPFAFCLFTCLSEAQTLAPGAPGKDAQWATAGKQTVGTSVNLESKVWFTLAQGVMTEVYYPDVTIANVHLLQFVVVDPKTKKVETEQMDAIHEIKVLRPDSPTFQQINTAKSGAWKITKTYTTDTERDSVLIDVQFESEDKDLELHLYYDPSLANSGMHDTAWTKDDALLAQDKEISSAIVANPPIWAEGKSFGQNGKVGQSIYNASNGFYGINDGLTELINNREKSYKTYFKAENGNVVQVAPINRNVKAKQIDDLNVGIVQKKTNFTISLAFGKTTDEALNKAQTSLKKGFKKTLAEYEKGWSDYVKTLRKVEPKYQAQFNMSAMQLKMLEDKTVRGANIASLTVPWGGDKNANENTVGGYHLIWSRDLYQVATAFMALGDKDAAIRALDFLFKVQQKPDGSFPQNSFLDGKPFWGSLQMDEVAFPLILAYQLGRNDKATYENHVKRAADFIVKNGPKTPQERWEEEGGYSPSTIAAEIAGLVCAAEIARKNNDSKSADLWLKTADEWQANVEKWTVTTNGKYSKSPYYVRITQNGKPDAGEKIELNNGAGFFDEREIVDAGFLELVRLGIKSPDDPIIKNSLKVIDEVIRVKTLNGDAFYRYNHDGYGEMDDGRRWNWDGKYTGKGRLWALLSGERGQYELALAQIYKGKISEPLKGERGFHPKYDLEKRYKFFAESRLDSMAKFANEGLMIPEQIWDSPIIPKNADKQFVPELKFGEGTGSATPLAWSMAQFIRLAVNLQEGKNLDTPDVVYNRYVLGKKSESDNSRYVSSGPNWELPVSGRSLENLKSNSKKDLDELPEEVTFKQPIKKSYGSWQVNDNCYNNWMFKQSGNTPNESPRFWGDCVFISYFGDAKKVEIAGDFTDWKPENFGSNTKVFSLQFAKTARVEYKLIVDGKWINDPLNLNKVDNGVGGENSVLTMPDYKPTVWDKNRAIQIKDLESATELVTDKIEIDSKIYGKRKVQVYSPQSYGRRKLKKFPVLYLQDGTDYFN